MSRGKKADDHQQNLSDYHSDDAHSDSDGNLNNTSYIDEDFSGINPQERLRLKGIIRRSSDFAFVVKFLHTFNTWLCLPTYTLCELEDGLIDPGNSLILGNLMWKLTFEKTKDSHNNLVGNSMRRAKEVDFEKWQTLLTDVWPQVMRALQQTHNPLLQPEEGEPVKCDLYKSDDLAYISQCDYDADAGLVNPPSSVAEPKVDVPEVKKNPFKMKKKVQLSFSDISIELRLQVLSYLCMYHMFRASGVQGEMEEKQKTSTLLTIADVNSINLANVPKLEEDDTPLSTPVVQNTSIVKPYTAPNAANALYDTSVETFNTMNGLRSICLGEDHIGNTYYHILSEEPWIWIDRSTSVEFVDLWQQMIQLKYNASGNSNMTLEQQVEVLHLSRYARTAEYRDNTKKHSKSNQQKYNEQDEYDSDLDNSDEDEDEDNETSEDDNKSSRAARARVQPVVSNVVQESTKQDVLKLEQYRAQEALLHKTKVESAKKYPHANKNMNMLAGTMGGTVYSMDTKDLYADSWGVVVSSVSEMETFLTQQCNLANITEIPVLCDKVKPVPKDDAINDGIKEEELDEYNRMLLKEEEQQQEEQQIKLEEEEQSIKEEEYNPSGFRGRGRGRGRGKARIIPGGRGSGLVAWRAARAANVPMDDEDDSSYRMDLGVWREHDWAQFGPAALLVENIARLYHAYVNTWLARVKTVAKRTIANAVQKRKRVRRTATDALLQDAAAAAQYNLEQEQNDTISASLRFRRDQRDQTRKVRNESRLIVDETVRQEIDRLRKVYEGQEKHLKIQRKLRRKKREARHQRYLSKLEQDYYTQHGKVQEDGRVLCHGVDVTDKARIDLGESDVSDDEYWKRQRAGYVQLLPMPVGTRRRLDAKSDEELNQVHPLQRGLQKLEDLEASFGRVRKLNKNKPHAKYVPRMTEIMDQVNPDYELMIGGHGTLLPAELLAEIVQSIQTWYRGQKEAAPHDPDYSDMEEWDVLGYSSNDDRQIEEFCAETEKVQFVHPSLPSLKIKIKKSEVPGYRPLAVLQQEQARLNAMRLQQEAETLAETELTREEEMVDLRKKKVTSGITGAKQAQLASGMTTDDVQELTYFCTNKGVRQDELAKHMLALSTVRPWVPMHLLAFAVCPIPTVYIPSVQDIPRVRVASTPTMGILLEQQQLPKVYHTFLHNYATRLVDFFRLRQALVQTMQHVRSTMCPNIGFDFNSLQQTYSRNMIAGTVPDVFADAQFLTPELLHSLPADTNRAISHTNVMMQPYIQFLRAILGQLNAAPPIGAQFIQLIHTLTQEAFMYSANAFANPVFMQTALGTVPVVNIYAQLPDFDRALLLHNRPPPPIALPVHARLLHPLSADAQHEMQRVLPLVLNAHPQQHAQIEQIVQTEQGRILFYHHFCRALA